MSTATMTRSPLSIERQYAEYYSKPNTTQALDTLTSIINSISNAYIDAIVPLQPNNQKKYSTIEKTRREFLENISEYINPNSILMARINEIFDEMNELKLKDIAAYTAPYRQKENALDESEHTRFYYGRGFRGTRSFSPNEYTYSDVLLYGDIRFEIYKDFLFNYYSDCGNIWWICRNKYKIAM